jgi:hypothetical protein
MTAAPGGMSEPSARGGRQHWRGNNARRADRPRLLERIWRVAGVCGWCCAVLLSTPASGGAGEEAQGRLLFRIPSQPLASALQAYSLTSGVQLLYESEVAEGRRSTAIDGEFTREAALARLLTGTDVTASYARSDAVTLALPAPAQDEPPADPLTGADLSLDTLRVKGTVALGDRLTDYSRAIEVDIRNALRRDAKTRKGDYRVAVRLWIDPSRMVRRAELMQSSGDLERDTVISGLLQGLMLSQAAPANMPQPVRLVILVKRP